MKTNLVVVNQAVLNQLFTLAESLAKNSTDSEVGKDLVNLRKNVYVLPSEAERLAGELMVRDLYLKMDLEYAARVRTAWGTKTPVGLFRNLANQIEEIQVEFTPVPLLALQPEK